MAGGGGGGQNTQTTSRSINAQDSYVASEGSILGQNVVAYTLGQDSGDLTITDGGAFDLVGKVAAGVKELVMDLYSQTSKQVSTVLSANAQQSQEAALSAQQNSNKLLTYLIGAGLVLGVVWIYKR